MGAGEVDMEYISEIKFLFFRYSQSNAMMPDIVKLRWYGLREAKKRLERRVGAQTFRALMGISDASGKTLMRT